MLKLAIILCTVLFGSSSGDSSDSNMFNKQLDLIRAYYEIIKQDLMEHVLLLKENEKAIFQDITDALVNDTRIEKNSAEGTDISECILDRTKLDDYISSVIERMQQCVDKELEEQLEIIVESALNLEIDFSMLNEGGLSTPELDESEALKFHEESIEMLVEINQSFQLMADSFKEVYDDICIPSIAPYYANILANAALHDVKNCIQEKKNENSTIS